ncbi:hypothetical protein GO986_08620 [Deinococcus sp. HMF7620]|uniref:Uncharacterized protein n=1 Tax=Deinococcus arboris TaxID=2682977 RepID=A0A7C9M612_9DEIO|nr:hypothetical protein [Deinococcus arboris]MVN86825.1 hypothetical protein [Deinococcus arboris]
MKQIRVGKAGFNGQDPKLGITYKVATSAVKGDIVGPTTNAGEVGRPAAAAKFVGQLITKEADGYGTVERGLVNVARRTGAISVGIQNLQADGTGGVQAGTGVECHVIATDSDSVAFYIL